ncbi:VCBS repeat-containing protein [Tamlana sp. 2201CG12-4]|uniref:VCBS repeat-containing protein n=1 Tax=Tamlana sp. 2201CG12-4 TaxID=3112582 RepID=UPI002DB86066|nr:VCBS repeat-containing protein [Tamlana sp. 2201CG12-4]MEC3906680.1 VCBS repeat-containing protein [Tamlana sp. 2201CG12-4]
MEIKQYSYKLSVVLKCALFILLFISFACEKENENVKKRTLFSLIDAEHTSIDFKNTVTEDLYFNFLNYAYIYNGAGVAVGDINNDGLDDLYFSSNQESNKLYLNTGDLKFKDITTKALVEDSEGWTTGVSMIDINNDGWLDIYVCKSGSLKSHQLRKNKLFINQKDNTFKEEAAQYGLDHFGFSVQAYFFDYDNDSDLDMYLVNHRADFRNNITVNPAVLATKEAFHSDQLFRNDGKIFSNVTKEVGIENKAWGLSASIGDFNNDNLQDIFVANDFLEPDFLYINQGNGTFKDEVLTRFKHISANSMGSDYADINNDLKPDLVVLDMLAEDHIRGKENMATMSTDQFNFLVNNNYHHQYMSNMLQLNNGNGYFSEIGQLTGIAKTDWSWAPLIADFDHDGYNDLLITNGIENDLSNQDFRNQMRTNIQNRKKVSLDEAINMMPSAKLSNYIFQNNKNLGFNNKTQHWGLDKKINSCGAVYADLDNDGDLDIVLNNQGEAASIYRNNINGNFINFRLEGAHKNPNGIGSSVTVYTQGLQQSKTLFVSRGYQSSVTNKLHFGIGNQNKIDSILVTWPDNNQQFITAIDANQTVTLKYSDSHKNLNSELQDNTLFESITPSEIGIHYTQKENLFDDYKLQLLLPQKQSEKSTPLAVGDINNDGLDDFFVGNAKGESGALYIQKANGTFAQSNKNVFDADQVFEDTDAVFVDIDNDGDLDLYIASGGYEIPENSRLLQDRLYKNDGKGHFKKEVLPEHLYGTKKVIFADWDQDGDQDLFIAGAVIHGKYPLASNSKLFENQKGILKDVTTELLPETSGLRMVNDAVFTDFDTDGDLDLIAVGEWMGIVFFENNTNIFKQKEVQGLSDLNGWYQTIAQTDIDNDGLPDYLIGNWGNNNKFHPTKDKPLHIYADYFDDNKTFDVVLSKVSKTGDLLPVRGKECSSQQTPFINEKLKTYKAFATSTLPDIYGANNLKKALHYKAEHFSSILLKQGEDGTFDIKALPVQAQFSPTLGFEILDINGDGYSDVFGVGNVYDAEVETIRYDASTGYVLLGNKDVGLKHYNDMSYFNNKEAKTVKKIKIQNQLHIIILNKNSGLNILKFKSSF